MRIAQSRLTSQGQVSVPAEVRRRLGLAPGAVIEWDAVGDAITVRRARRFTTLDVHKLLFQSKPAARSLAELKAGPAKHAAAKHARR